VKTEKKELFIINFLILILTVSQMVGIMGNIGEKVVQKTKSGKLLPNMELGVRWR
jgi:hypothetical protein